MADNEVALAYPRVIVPDRPEVALPQPLTPSDAALARRIFSLQDHGRLAAAEALVPGLQSSLLRSDILADRYLGPYHHSTVAELQGWLADYPDQPDAPAIHALLVRRLGPGRQAPPAPEKASLALPASPTAAAPPDPDPQPGITRKPWLDSAVASRLQRDEVHAALHLIAHTKGVEPAYAALLKAEVARRLFTGNHDTEALHVAAAALHETAATHRVGKAAYIAGLAAWRLGRTEQARTLFQEGAKAPVASSSVHAAAAFWAARAELRLHQRKAALHWMRKAAKHRSTFHGLIARRVLGLQTGIIPNAGLLSQADVDAVAATAAGRHAFALLQVKQDRRAADELRVLWAQVKDETVMRRSLLLVAAATGLRHLAGEFAALEAAADGAASDLPPLPELHPRHGFQVDPALVYAVARTESNFDPKAVSPAGARGLMQLMPVTARFVAGDAVSAETLQEPGLNLALGQRYIAWLAQQPAIGDNLLRLLAGYNLGPNGVAKWIGAVRDQGDPLLFIEEIPVPETRNFVREVLTWSWLYAARLRVPAPSLDALAADEFPRFTPASVEGKLAAAASAD